MQKKWKIENFIKKSVKNEKIGKKVKNGKFYKKKSVKNEKIGKKKVKNGKFYKKG